MGTFMVFHEFHDHSFARISHMLFMFLKLNRCVLVFMITVHLELSIKHLI